MANPNIRADLIFRRVDNDFVVYDPVSDATSLLNLHAAAVLDLCDGSRNVWDIAEYLAGLMDESGEKWLPDVERALDDFKQKGFLAVTAENDG